MLDLKIIPNEPGCYLFKDKNKRVIYIGKAKNLKKRVKQYFQKNNFDLKTKSMVKKISSIDFIATDNEVEAIILEDTLIKKHQPKYNIRLKDAKSHSYILLTDESFPRIQIARTKSYKGRYFGPFISAQERDYILQFLKKTFLLRTCKRLPKKACLRYHINLCEGPCIAKISEKQYNEKITNLKLILNGNTEIVIKKLKKQMEKSSKNKDFEKSIIFRNQINALENLKERQKVLREKKYNEDIINFEIKDNKIYLMLFNIYKGTLNNKDEYVFDYKNDFLEEFIILYYSDNPVPKELILPIKINNSINEYLSKKKKSKVKITIPKKGEKKQLLDLVLKNIEITYFSDFDKIKTLKNKLNLNEDPNVIECFDISHLSGTSTTGSMVQFRNGKPDKNNYRRFKIRTVNGIDDTKAIKEVVRRRYKRLKKEKTQLPDLIIIDGGKGQLNSAIKALEDLELKIPIISIAKHFEEIYIPGETIALKISRKDKALHFIQEIRDEAHRFAIKYNKLLRRKELIP